MTRKIRLTLAKWLWPKDVREGELFTIVNHKRPNGEITTDGSWVGETLRADIVDGDRIMFSTYNSWESQWRIVGSCFIVPDVTCTIKPLEIPLTPQEKQTMYQAVK